MRSAAYHEKIPAARDFACKENSGQNTSGQKNGLGKRPVRFFVFTSAVTIRLEIHSEAVSPEEALPEPAAWGLAGERIKTAFLGELHAGQDASQYPVLLLQTGNHPTGFCIARGRGCDPVFF